MINLTLYQDYQGALSKALDYSPGQKDGGLYFGPYPDSGAANEIKKLLDRIFPLRNVKILPTRSVLLPYWSM